MLYAAQPPIRITAPQYAGQILRTVHVVLILSAMDRIRVTCRHTPTASWRHPVAPSGLPHSAARGTPFAPAPTEKRERESARPFLPLRGLRALQWPLRVRSSHCAACGRCNGRCNGLRGPTAPMGPHRCRPGPGPVDGRRARTECAWSADPARPRHRYAGKPEARRPGDEQGRGSRVADPLVSVLRLGPYSESG